MCIVDICFENSLKLTLNDVELICVRNDDSYIICNIDVINMERYSMYHIKAYDFDNDDDYKLLTVYI